MRRQRHAALLVALLVGSLGLGTLAQTIDLPRPVPSFSQAYSDGPGAWGDCPLGTDGCPDLLRITGCLTTALASVLAYHNVELTVDASTSCTGRARTGMDPGILNDWLQANRGYGRCVQDPIGNCCIDWGRLPAEIELTFHVNRSEVGINPVASIVIDHALRQGNPILAGVHWGAFCHGSTSQTEDCHWIVLTGRSGDTYTIIDTFNPDPTSRYGVRTTLDAGVHGAYIIDRFAIVERSAWTSGPVGNATPDPGSEPTAGSAASVVALFGILATVAALVVFVTVTGDR